MALYCPGQIWPLSVVNVIPELSRNRVNMKTKQISQNCPLDSVTLTSLILRAFTWLEWIFTFLKNIAFEINLPLNKLNPMSLLNLTSIQDGPSRPQNRRKEDI